MTTRRQFAVNILAAFLMTGTLFAQEFWEKKEYLAWTSEEITRLTTDSPWAKELKVTSGGKDVTLTVTWLTALPIKQALLKERMDEGGILADSAKEIMTVDENYLAIGITGLPSEIGPKLTEAWLKIPNMPDIQPSRGDFQESGRTVTVMILFPRPSSLTVDDKEVEVVLKVDDMEFARKFPLNSMVYNGKLEL